MQENIMVKERKENKICIKIINLLRRWSVEALAVLDCIELNWCCITLRLLDALLLDITDAAEGEEAIGATLEMVDPEIAWPDWPSTGFLER